MVKQQYGYGTNHNGGSPSSFRELLDGSSYIHPNLFICPSDASFSRQTITKENVDRLSSYMLMPNVITNTFSDTPLIIEKLDAHGDRQDFWSEA